MTLIEAHPGDVEAYNLLGIIDDSQLKTLPALWQTLQQALKIAPTPPKLRSISATSMSPRKNFDLAEKEFQRRFEA